MEEKSSEGSDAPVNHQALSGTQSSDTPRNRFLRFITDGPDPVEAKEPLTLRETLLPWPIRCAVVATVCGVAYWWRNTGYGQLLAWELQAGAFALVSILETFWLEVLLVDLSVALLWFIDVRVCNRCPTLLHLVALLNRQIGHGVALFVWCVIALGSSSVIWAQTAGLAAIVLLGPPFINCLARQPWKIFSADSLTKFDGNLLWRRRILIYVASLVGLGVLAFLARHQLVRILPLELALGLGVFVRTIRYYTRRRRSGRAGTEEQTIRTQFRSKQSTWARNIDPIGVTLVIGAQIGLIALSWWGKYKLYESSDAKLSAVAGDPCARGNWTSASGALAVFLVADTHSHELGGSRFPGQNALTGVFAPGGSRTTALDVLAAVPLSQLGAMHRTLAGKRPEGTLPWAYLGDLADLDCQGELDRGATMLDAFMEPSMLFGFVPGNHDMSFLGTLHFSPYWRSACKSGVLDEDDTIRRLQGHFGQRIRSNAGSVMSSGPGVVKTRASVMFQVTSLGIIAQGDRKRGVIGLFIDTGDRNALDWGLPGNLGTVSEQQIRAIDAALGEFEKAPETPYGRDPAYVLFGHVPYSQLTESSRKRIAELVRKLDGKERQMNNRARVLAYIGAHTHIASNQVLCVAGRKLPEIVIGSTIDAPQQAALLQIGLDREGRLAAEVQTIQTVARPGFTCGQGLTVTASECQRVAASLISAVSCRPCLGLVGESAAPRDCQEIERPLSVEERWSALRSFRGPLDLDEERERQQNEATQLLQCICRAGDCTVPPEPFRDEAHEKVLRQILNSGAHQTELVCLAWAASTSQLHSSVNMTLGEALRCAFGDSSVPPEATMTANEEVPPCY